MSNKQEKGLSQESVDKITKVVREEGVRGFLFFGENQKEEEGHFSVISDLDLVNLVALAREVNRQTATYMEEGGMSNSKIRTILLPGRANLIDTLKSLIF